MKYRPDWFIMRRKFQVRQIIFFTFFGSREQDAENMHNIQGNFSGRCAQAALSGA